MELLNSRKWSSLVSLKGITSKVLSGVSVVSSLSYQKVEVVLDQDVCRGTYNR